MPALHLPLAEHPSPVGARTRTATIPGTALHDLVMPSGVSGGTALRTREQLSSERVLDRERTARLIERFVAADPAHPALVRHLVADGVVPSVRDRPGVER